ncbi:cyclic nucleotide-binding domain-containing protein [Polynucleobacter sp. JS-Fieb-80-E5]|uniref:cyclic nucleotide-binding domain-containing protein n=1 Tax=Polynucleobacter sp. JS-Fieb-80-E5 TaxID=2081050 RepID=UPI001C0AFE8F|nr:cyclic nucleotide-binding domain-containing protein [Polynucleobacter sp. JS-Fieb-80-E5]MBU3617852.1 cyclic nucleotide-binding domain-containing protein [Polynucleobacter sp. JS-Fieb-80-E5]
MFGHNSINSLLKKAENGDAGSQVKLAKEFLSGDNIGKSFVKAYANFAMAARQNNIEGLFQVAHCQSEGIGCDIDPSKAFFNFSEAARLGHPGAMLALAKYYEDGIGGLVDHQKALSYYSHALKLGQNSAQAHIQRLISAQSITPQRFTQNTGLPSSVFDVPIVSGPQQPITYTIDDVNNGNQKLGDIPFFRGLETNELIQVISSMGSLKAQAGQCLFIEGQAPNGLFIILSGRCSIRLTTLNNENTEEIMTLGAGQYVGEFGSIDGMPRSATVLVTEDAHLMFLPTAAFRAAIEKSPAIAQTITINLLCMVIDQNIIPKDKTAYDFVYSGNGVPHTFESMKALVAIMRQANSENQEKYFREGV